MANEQRKTRYSDVCGTTDELKRILAEEPERLAQADGSAVDLAKDIQSMMDRMQARELEYRGFRDAILAIAAELARVPEGPRDSVRGDEAEALAALEGGTAAGVAARLERVRAAANGMERTLRVYRSLAARTSLAYRAVRGDRNWAVDEGAAAAPLAIPPELEGWLPPAPHRAIVLEWLSRGRLRLVASDPPQVEFEDGGRIPLHEARWSGEVENFHRKDEVPNARAYRLYRG